MKRIRLDAVGLTLVVFASIAHGAQPGCKETVTMAKNRDGSTLVLTVGVCPDEGERRIRADLRPATGPARTVLREKQDLEEIKYGSAKIIDLDKDGQHEIEVLGSCGAGPNCEGTVYRLNAAGRAMTPFYRGGYFSLTMIDGYLVETGRASCCSWESHGLKVRPGADRVADDDLEYMINVDSEGGEDGKVLAVQCSFRRRNGKEWTYVAPPSDAWLPLCEQYGKKYTLHEAAKPAR
jgi:hypothetical protein